MIAAYQENLFKDFSVWFTELAELAQNATDNSSLPKLELLLQTGNILCGSIVASKKTASDVLLMLMSTSDAHNKSQITLVSASQVVALTLVDPNFYIKTFTAPTTNAIVGSLELKRAAKNKEVELQQIVKAELQIVVDAEAIAETSRADILRTVMYLPEIFKDLTSDELGKKLVQTAIDNIRITTAANASTTLTGHTLLLQVVSPLTLMETKEKERIKSSIESVL